MIREIFPTDACAVADGGECAIQCFLVYSRAKSPGPRWEEGGYRRRSVEGGAFALSPTTTGSVVVRTIATRRRERERDAQFRATHWNKKLGNNWSIVRAVAWLVPTPHKRRRGSLSLTLREHHHHWLFDLTTRIFLLLLLLLFLEFRNITYNIGSGFFYFIFIFIFPRQISTCLLLGVDIAADIFPTCSSATLTQQQPFDDFENDMNNESRKLWPCRQRERDTLY